MTTGATVLAACLLASACGGGDDPAPGPDDDTADGAPVYQPDPGTSWQWQLQGTLNTGYDVALYDVDLFDTPAATIADLQAAGRRVICYFSAGSFEQWREDANDFPPTALGEALDGWPGERWLDIRATGVRDVMAARIALADEKGCDGVEPDNVDGYTQDSGFDLSARDQLDYNRFLAATAHGHGLSVGLKNDLEQVPALVDRFDFAVNESCHRYNECNRLQPFIDAGKAVFNAEYGQRYVNDPAARAQLCDRARAAQLSTLVLPEALDDSFRFACE